MQWRKWWKIASLWQFELDAKSGPLETGDFSEIGENCQRAGDNGNKHPVPLETGDFGENGDFGKIGENRQRAGDIQNVANIRTGCQELPLQSA